MKNAPASRNGRRTRSKIRKGNECWDYKKNMKELKMKSSLCTVKNNAKQLSERELHAKCITAFNLFAYSLIPSCIFQLAKAKEQRGERGAACREAESKTHSACFAPISKISGPSAGAAAGQQLWILWLLWLPVVFSDWKHALPISRTRFVLVIWCTPFDLYIFHSRRGK